MNKKTSSTHVIEVPEDATIKNAAAFREILLDALQKHDRVSLDLSGVVQLDMSFFQLLCAGHKSAPERGNEFVLELHAASDTVRDLVRLAGFSRHVGCSFSDASTCLWLEEV